MSHRTVARRSRLLVATVLMLGAAARVQAFCGCDKPPPPRASVRPFFGYADQMITLFDDRLVPGLKYTVKFTTRDGDSDWSRGRAVTKRDLADGAPRKQLRVAVPALAFGPAEITVFNNDNDEVYSLADDQFTIIAPPIILHDFAETLTRDDYQTGVGADGTVFIAFDTSAVSNATTYSGLAVGFPLRFDGANVAIFNTQGFLGEVLQTNSNGLFRLSSVGSETSTALEYWRHEFQSYKDQHRKRDDRRTADGEWHADGTRHVDNYHLVMTISGRLTNGEMPTPGATPPFSLVLNSTSAPANTLR